MPGTGLRLTNHAKRFHTREVSIVGDERRSVDDQSARGLDGIRKLEAERGSKPCRTLRDPYVQFNTLPRLENGTVATGEGFVTGLQWAGEDFGHCDRRDGEA